jgi:hypothetical protein
VSSRPIPRLPVAALFATVTGLSGLFPGAAARAQEPIPLLSVGVDPADFGVDGVEAIGRGRVSVVYWSDRTELQLQLLREDPTLPRISYPEPPAPPEPVHPRDAIPRQTALWVWRTRQILDDGAERARFLDFVRDQGITRIFLYLASPAAAPPSRGYIPFDSGELGPLLAQLRERGALTYALDGDPYYALAENHGGVLRTVERLVAHNRSVPEEQRFYGVRYDIEPYLVPGFRGGRREELLDGYVTVLGSASVVARAGGLRFAADVPFWLDAPDEETGEVPQARMDGRRAPVLEHLMTVLDDMAVMDYRTSALGPNGAITHAHGEIELAARFGVEVFVGVETTRLNDEDLFTFFGPSTEGLPAHGRARWIVLAGQGDGRGRLWLVDGDEALDAVRDSTRQATLLRHWPAGRPARVSADLQSFYALGETRMREETVKIIRYLAGRPTFAGIAIHDYQGYRRLVGGR